MVERDKNLRDYKASDFVKYFSRRFFQVNNRIYSTNFARDCSIMLKIMRLFHKSNIPFKGIFKFIDDMFEEYPKRRRIKDIDLNWLHAVAKLYINNNFGKKEEPSNKVKAPEIVLDDEMKKWLQEEKKKWLEGNDAE